MIEPILSDEAFVEDVHRCLESGGVDLHLWWLGQMGFLVVCKGRSILLDPYLSDSLTRKYEHTKKPHVRMTRRVVEPGVPFEAIAITAGHAHTDHLDAETLRPMLAKNSQAMLVCPEAIRVLARERSGLPDSRILGLDAGEEVRIGDAKFLAVASAHEHLDVDSRGRCLYLGFVLEWSGWRLYHSSDTVLYEGLAEALKPHSVDVAMLPINGADPSRGVAGNLSGPEAARLAHAMGARLAIPGHFEMFTFNTASTEPFADSCRLLDQPFLVLNAGQRVTLSSHQRGRHYLFPEKTNP